MPTKHIRANFSFFEVNFLLPLSLSSLQRLKVLEFILSTLIGILFRRRMMFLLLLILDNY